MPRGKKNSATSAVSKTVSKTAVEPIKETAAEPEKKSMKPTAEKKKATAPKKPPRQNLPQKLVLRKRLRLPLMLKRRMFS